MARPVCGRRSLSAALVAALALIVGPAASAGGAVGPLSFIENGTIRVGVDLGDGGKITYLSHLSGEQAHDLLQDVQQSYYGGTPDATWHVAASGGLATMLLHARDVGQSQRERSARPESADQHRRGRRSVYAARAGASCALHDRRCIPPVHLRRGHAVHRRPPS